MEPEPGAFRVHTATVVFPVVVRSSRGTDQPAVTESCDR